MKRCLVTDLKQLTSELVKLQCLVPTVDITVEIRNQDGSGWKWDMGQWYAYPYIEYPK